MAVEIGGHLRKRTRAAGAVSKWKAVRAAARCQKSVRKTQIGRARRHYPHGGEVTRQKLCAGKMRGGNSASGQAGNHIIGIPAASSATYGRRQCGDGCSSPFFHYYNIIVTFLICRGFSIGPRKPRNTGVPACQVRLFYIASAGLDKYFVRWYNICAKEQMFVLARGVYPNHRPVSPGGYFNRKTEQMFD